MNYVDPYLCTLRVASSPVVFEIDTGAAVTIVNEAEFAKLAKKENLQLVMKDLPKLRTYAGKILHVLGRVTTMVSHCRNSAELDIYVVAGDGPNLLGRDSLVKLKLNWNFVFNIHGDSSVHILSEYPELFKTELGTWKHGKVKLAIDSSAKPRFLKARTVPYALQQVVDAELDRLVQEEIISPVDYSEWAAPIVPVMKSSGQVRICGDYKCTINQSARVDKYPLPNIEDLYQKLSQGRFFTKLDLSNAYLQLLLDDDSRLLTTINTSKGLFVYNRLPFGVSAAPAIFQRTMDQLVAGLPFVVVYLDDIMVSGRTRAEHDSNLRAVLDWLQSAGLKLNRAKCHVSQTSITFLGHVIDASGIRPSTDKIQDLLKAPIPTNVPELRSYLGLMNYYHRFLKNLSSVLAPLYELLPAKEWRWTPKQQSAFDDSKAMLLSGLVRVHYDPKLPIVVTCDASPYGVGAVLSHKMSDGTDRPVAFASRTLSPAEKNYSQLDREALAVVFGVTRFHKFVYGRSFLLQTDHKPLLGLLQSDRPVPPLASGRIQRWALKLANYQYELQFKPGLSNGCADGLSRLPNPMSIAEVPPPAEAVLSMSILESTPVTAAMIAQWTAKDPVLSLVFKFVRSGWPQAVADDLQAYYRRRDEFSILNGCVLLGARVVIPAAGRAALLEELHSGHPGITRMKALARSYTWWPTIDAEIEQMVRSCSDCQAISRAPNQQQVHPWEWPGKPWLRIHIDYAGPVEGKMILVIVDSHSKFIDAHLTTSATSAVTIRKLRQTFAMLGLPQNIVSDNGPAFVSSEFKHFCLSNGIKHTCVAPYHPSSNGLAERAVQTVKNGLKKERGPDLESRLFKFLFTYRITPHSTTGQTPFDLLWHQHRPRSRLDLVFPDSGSTVLKRQIAAHDRGGSSSSSEFRCGDPVFAMTFTSSSKWVAGILEECLGPLTFTVRLSDGRLWKRHVDHLRSRLPAETSLPQCLADSGTLAPLPALPSLLPAAPQGATSSPVASPSDESFSPSVSDSLVPPASPASPARPGPLPPAESTPRHSRNPASVVEPRTSSSPNPVPLRRSARAIKCPVRLNL